MLSLKKTQEKIQMITDQCGIWILEENMMSLEEKKCLIRHPGVYPTVRASFCLIEFIIIISAE